jgi:1-phosphatidylinositol-3-phosphate 5-kinase
MRRLTTSSQDYEYKLKGIKDPALPPSSNISDTPNPSKPPSRDGEPPASSQAPPTPLLSSTNDIEAALLRPTGTHMKYQFQEGSANFFCKIFYAEQFDALRTNCGCDDHYIQSLSRCLKWDSSGGKSKSAFLKTLGISFVDMTDSRRPTCCEANVEIRDGCFCEIRAGIFRIYVASFLS